ncbi:hypothetical protein FRC09_008286 [Ceratobasidium sp. 395]|nr:hypothetical protein FRC09_008286 [Ceratobasidium sp. 395]
MSATWNLSSQRAPIRLRIKSIDVEFQTYPNYPVKLKLLSGVEPPYNTDNISSAERTLHWQDLVIYADKDGTIEIRVYELRWYGRRRKRMGSAWVQVLELTEALASVIAENTPAQTLFSVTLALDSTGASHAAAQVAQIGASNAVARSQDVRQKMERARAAVETIVNIVEPIAELNPIAKTTVALFKVALEALKKQTQLEELVEKLVTEMGDLLPLVAAMENRAKIQKLQDTTKELLLLVEDASRFVIEYMSDSPLAAKELLDKLLIPGAIYSLNEGCLKGTRKQIIQNIQGWALDETGSPPLYWLYGPAGCGKSAVATSISKLLSKGGTLAGSFFCRRDNEYLRQPENVISQLAHSLAYKCPAYRAKLVEALRNDPNLPQSPTKPRYRGLIASPLQSIEQGAEPSTLVVIVDAIDESGTAETRRVLMKCLLKLSRLVHWLKILVTSRPNDELRNLIELEQEHTYTRNLFEEDADRDIATYIQARLNSIKETGRAQWPNYNDTEGLSARSNGLFIWARTACNLIENSDDPSHSLDQILGGQRSENEREAIGAIYTAALDEGLREANINEQTFRLCVGAIVLTVSRRPLREASLATLLVSIQPHQLSRVINRLGAVLHRDGQGVVRVLHHSFSDYMMETNCPEKYRIDPVSQNAELAASCLGLMLQDLVFNICGLQDSSVMNCNVVDLQARVEAGITPELRYSCTYWTSHLVESAFATASSNTIDLLDKLLCGKHLIYWIEVMSLSEELHMVTKGMAQLIDWVNDDESKYTKIAEDVYRFVFAAYEAISSSTPHLYVSALPFGAANYATIQALGLEFPNTLSLKSGMNIWNSPCLRVIQTPGAINSISISPDGRRIVSGSMDGALQVWDAQTGRDLTLSSLSGHSEAVTSVAFSRDGLRIVSGSRDGTLRVWNAETGGAVLPPLEGHSHWVTSVAFSSNGRRIVSGSDDETVRVWDAREGTMSLGPLRGHKGAVTSVAISSDDTLIASGSWDRTVWIWDARTGRPHSQKPLNGHTDYVASVAFSSDSRYIVSGSRDKTIRVWDAQAGKMHLGPLRGHSDWVTAVAFSSDGRRIVSCSRDKSARIWCAQNGKELLDPFEGHSADMTSVTFSSDGRRIISSSRDKEMRIWDAQACASLLDPLPGHSDEVTAVAYSFDGRSIVSGSQDKTVRIWDAHTGDARLEPFRAHSKGVTSVAFSPDDKRIVSGSMDMTIRIWDAQTGVTILGPLKGHSDAVMSVAFSSDGGRIVSSSWDRTVQTCDAATGEFRSNPIKGHIEEVVCAAFSPDGQLIVSGSDDMTVRVWNAHTGDAALKALIGHSKRVTTVAFSPDAKLIISGSADMTVRIWDAQSGAALLRPLRVHDGAITSVAFSPNSRCIVSGSWDTTLCIWDAMTGTPLLEPLRGHSKGVMSVAFSTDGERIVSGSSDGSIRTWGLSAPCDTQKTSECSGRVSSKEISGRLRNHWVYEPSGERLFWVPPAYQRTRLDHSLMVISVNPDDHPVIYDLSGLKAGTQWTEVVGPPKTK